MCIVDRWWSLHVGQFQAMDVIFRQHQYPGLVRIRFVYVQECSGIQTQFLDGGPHSILKVVGGWSGHRQ